MFSLIVMFAGVLAFCSADTPDCVTNCPPGEMQCAFDPVGNVYKMFSSKCAMAAYMECHSNAQYIQTPLKYCIKYLTTSRRMYGDSCPVFCPNYYRPVCGSSRLRSYNYRAFNNGCYLDMINCRGDEDFSSYIEVPLQFCQNHLMKNIFKEQVVVTDLRDDYHDDNI